MSTLYSQTLTADSGAPPYSGWKVSSGSLPPGLTLNSTNGTIAGTPTSAAGSPFSFSVTVSDSRGSTSAPKSLSISIVSATPTLRIVSLSPSSRSAGSAGFTLAVSGTGFATGAVVQWNGQPLSTTLVSATQLTAAVTADRITTPGSAAITVVSQNVTSAPVAFPITDRLTITSLNPSSRTAGTATFMLTVNGTGFATGAVVQWNGQPLSTTLVSATQLTATVTADRITAPGFAAITVFSQNVTSASVVFPITDRPNITSLNPSSRTAGTATFTLTVNGTGFATGAVVQWNGQPLSTTFVGSNNRPQRCPPIGYQRQVLRPSQSFPRM